MSPQRPQTQLKVIRPRVHLGKNLSSKSSAAETPCEKKVLCPRNNDFSAAIVYLSNEDSSGKSSSRSQSVKQKHLSSRRCPRDDQDEIRVTLVTC